MADFSSLKQTIRNYIKQNGNEEITGDILQDVLLAMVTTMGDGAINNLVTALQDEFTARQNQDAILNGNISAEATARQQADTALGGRIDGLQTAINGINTKLAEGYIYAGIATPSTNPDTISGKVFFIAVQAGTYTNLGGIVVAYGVTILKYNGSAWSSEQVLAIDNEPIAGSGNLVKSGGIYDCLFITVEESQEVSPGTTSNGILRTATGNVDSSISGWGVSDFISLSSMLSFNVSNGYGLVDAFCGIALYDSAMNYINIGLKGDGTEYYCSDYPSAKYLRFSLNLVNGGTKMTAVKLTPISKFDNLYATVNDGAPIKQDNTFEQGILRTDTGNVDSRFADWYTSPFIEVESVSSITTYLGYYILDNLCGVATYDENKTFIRAHAGGINVDLSSDLNARFVRFSGQQNCYAQIKGILRQGVNELFNYILPSINEQSGLFVVDPDGRYGFSTINDAVNASADGDTIVIYPGMYNEVVNLYDKTRHLVGVCRETCIIITHTQLRQDCPIDITSGSLENLTIIADASDAEIPESQKDMNTMAYGIHIDSRNTNPSPLYIRNCKIVSAWAAAVGIGCRYYDSIHFENCYFETQESIGTMGAITIHNDDFYPGQDGGFVEIKNSVIHGSLTKALSLGSLNNGASMVILFSGCSLWVGQDIVNDIILRTQPVGDNLAGEDISLHVASHGNNIQILNAS